MTTGNALFQLGCPKHQTVVPAGKSIRCPFCKNEEIEAELQEARAEVVEQKRHRDAAEKQIAHQCDSIVEWGSLAGAAYDMLPRVSGRGHIDGEKVLAWVSDYEAVAKNEGELQTWRVTAERLSGEIVKTHAALDATMPQSDEGPVWERVEELARERDEAVAALTKVLEAAEPAARQLLAAAKYPKGEGDHPSRRGAYQVLGTRLYRAMGKKTPTDLR